MPDVNLNITPTAEMAPVTTDTTGATTTTGTTASEGTSGILPSLAADQATEKSIAAAEGVATAQQAVEAAQAPALAAKAVAADAEAAASDAAAIEAARVRQNYLDRIGRVDAAVAEDEKKHANFQFHDYWSTLSVGKQIGSRIALALGGFAAGMLGGPNHALEKINADASRDFERQKLQLASRERIASLRRQGVTDLYGAMQRDLAALEIKQGLAHKAIAAKAQAEAIRQGIPLEQAQTHVLVAGSLATAADKNLAAKQRYELHFQQDEAKRAEQARQQSQQVTSAKGGKPEHSDVKETADIDEAMRNVDQMIEQVKKDPAAWQEYRDNSEHWQRMEASKGSHVANPVRVAGQMAGLANIAPEQGLKTEGGKTLHQRQEKLNTGIAKGFGGVITTGDREAAASQQGNLALSPEEKVKQLQEFKANLEQKRNEYIKNRGVKPQYSGTAAKPTGTDANGGIRKQVLDGAAWIKAHPDDPRVAQVRAGIARLNMQLGAP